MSHCGWCPPLPAVALGQRIKIGGGYGHSNLGYGTVTAVRVAYNPGYCDRNLPLLSKCVDPALRPAAAGTARSATLLSAGTVGPDMSAQAEPVIVWLKPNWG
jgi:hypothetical protein